MKERQILQNRASNAINSIKHKLKDESYMSIYNDLLIIQEIIRNLSKETLRKLITQIRILERDIQKKDKKQISIRKIVELLSESNQQDPLLQDFIQSTVYPIENFSIVDVK